MQCEMQPFVGRHSNFTQCDFRMPTIFSCSHCSCFVSGLYFCLPDSHLFYSLVAHNVNTSVDGLDFLFEDEFKLLLVNCPIYLLNLIMI